MRAILDAAVDLPEQNFLLALHATLSEVGGVEPELPGRTGPPPPVDFS